MMSWLYWLVLACSSVPLSEEPAVKPAPAPTQSMQPMAPDPSDPPEHVGIHQGVQHPPIPADSPAWRHDPGGFVPDVRFYGERDWDGVRMRVAGHIAVIERDRARLAARQQGYTEAARIYSELAETLDGLIPTGGGPAAEIPRMAQEAAKRDSALMMAMASQQPIVGESGLAGVRAFLLTHRNQKLGEEQLQKLREQLRVATSIEPRPDIDAFSDFDDRHQLRVKLWSMYADAVDPIQFRDPWGYFTWETYAAVAQDLRTEMDGTPPIDRRPQSFSVEGAGGMPTGDSLIDVAGQPGPKAIGRLEKLGLDDELHRQWLEDTVYVFNTKMKVSPGGVLPILDSRVAYLDKMGHGSRYYNIKQLRNEVVRRLADAGFSRLARQALATNQPLHHQDWECPNRAGILAAIDGRLAAIDGDKAADDRLREARALSDLFLAQVDAADR